MNRETKRLLQRQGQLDAEGNPAVGGARRQPPRPAVQPAGRAVGDRTRPADFVRDVRTELRRVAWPTRAETLNASTVVLIALIVLTAVIFAMDTSFAKFTLFLFKR
ncbi:MAG: preprotein translocase subunit SecE [Acidimicrobiales bacterium]